MRGAHAVRFTDIEEDPMAIIARFSIDVPFGRKAELFKLVTKWQALERELGFPTPEVLVGSIGTPESRVEINYRFASLSALEAVFATVAGEKRMAEYQKDMAPYIIPGSHRWDVLRVQE
jgi:hypothetical protein